MSGRALHEGPPVCEMWKCSSNSSWPHVIYQPATCCHSSQVRRWTKELFVERSNTAPTNEVKIVKPPSDNDSTVAGDVRRQDFPSQPPPAALRPRGSSSRVDTAAAKALALELAGIEDQGLDECEFMLYMLLVLNKLELKSIRDVTVREKPGENERFSIHKETRMGAR